VYAADHKLDDAQKTLERAVVDIPGSTEAKLTLARFLRSKRSREQGESLLKAYLAREPKNDQLRFGLADLQQQAGSTTEALATYKQVVSQDGTEPGGLYARDRIAAIYLAQGRDEDAGKMVKEVLDKSPRDVEGLYLRAEMALRKNDPTSA